MLFQITKTTYPEQTTHTWALVRASGEVICCGPRVFYGGEKEVRSQIAEAKRAMQGARRCKVEVVEKP
jgi:hypothetical protein